MRESPRNRKYVIDPHDLERDLSFPWNDPAIGFIPEAQPRPSKVTPDTLRVIWNPGKRSVKSETIRTRNLPSILFSPIPSKPGRECREIDSLLLEKIAVKVNSRTPTQFSQEPTAMRPTLPFSCCLFLCICTSTLRAARPEVEKPNIVIIFTDDK